MVKNASALLRRTRDIGGQVEKCINLEKKREELLA
jgi:hypothetical protein